MNSHPYYTDKDFVAKLPRYKTAWSPLYGRYVGIKSVSQNGSDIPIIIASVQGMPKNETIMFRATELEKFVL